MAIQSWLFWEGTSGLFYAIWLLLKPSGWKLHQLYHFLKYEYIMDPRYLLEESVSGLTRDRSCPETSWQSASGRRRRRRERRTILTILGWGAEWFMLRVRPTSYTCRLFNNSLHLLPHLSIDPSQLHQLFVAVCWSLENARIQIIH